jgi:hypothetical protein
MKRKCFCNNFTTQASGLAEEIPISKPRCATIVNHVINPKGFFRLGANEDQMVIHWAPISWTGTMLGITRSDEVSITLPSHRKGEWK